MSAGEPGAIEENAGAIDEASIRCRFVERSPISEFVGKLGMGRVESWAQRCDQHGFVLVEHLRSDRTTAQASRRGCIILDSRATCIPDTPPIRGEKIVVDLPFAVVVADVKPLLHSVRLGAHAEPGREAPN